MKLNSSKRIAILTYTACIVIMLAIATILCCACSNSPPQSLESQHRQIKDTFRGVDIRFLKLIFLEERTDDRGNPCYAGVLDPSLDEALGRLSEAYSNDPATTKPLSEEELRYMLTEGIVEATAEGTEDSALVHFLVWIDEPAELVYRGDVTHTDGTISRKGDPATSDEISNFDYYINPDSSSLKDYKPARE